MRNKDSALRIIIVFVILLVSSITMLFILQQGENDDGKETESRDNTTIVDSQNNLPEFDFIPEYIKADEKDYRLEGLCVRSGGVAIINGNAIPDHSQNCKVVSKSGEVIIDFDFNNEDYRISNGQSVTLVYEDELIQRVMLFGGEGGYTQSKYWHINKVTNEVTLVWENTYGIDSNNNNFQLFDPNYNDYVFYLQNGFYDYRTEDCGVYDSASNTISRTFNPKCLIKTEFIDSGECKDLKQITEFSGQEIDISKCFTNLDGYLSGIDLYL